MAKRVNTYKQFGYNSKKPRLDNLLSDDVPYKINGFWSDDSDDEVVLLATQVAETQQTIQAITNSEITFTNFGQNIKRTTSSTQKPSTSDVKQLLEEGDEDLSMLVMPGTTRLSPTTATQNLLRRQYVSEQQINILHDKIAALKKENKELKTELIDNKTTIDSKTGETALLRDELRHTKQQVQQLKLDKLLCAEQARKENRHKINELTKKLETQTTELQLKSAEYNSLKVKQFNESRRFDDSSLNISTVIEVEEKKETPKKPLKKRQIYRLNNLQLTVKDNSLINTGLYEPVIEECGCTLKHCRMEMARFQLLFVHLEKTGTLADETIVIKSFKKVLVEYESFLEYIKLKEECEIYYLNTFNFEYDILNEKRSLLQVGHVYKYELCAVLRRYMATLAEILKKLPHLANELLKTKKLALIVASIRKFGYSCDLFRYNALMESFTSLLCSLLLFCNIETETIHLFSEWFKELVFLCPNCYIFVKLSECLIVLIQRWPQIIDLLCINSDKRAFISDRLKQVYRFSQKSCVLQVYANLLSTLFPYHTSLHLQHYKLLTVISLNHVRFVFECFDKLPKYIKKQLDLIYEGESIIDTATTSKTQQTSKDDSEIYCQCYISICLSVVFILFQLLHYWQRNKQLALIEISRISQIAVHLLHTIFCENYTISLFQEAEEKIKNYLYLIIKWWTDNSSLLGFTETHMSFLKTLQSGPFLPKKLGNEEDLPEIEDDLKDWHTATNGVDVENEIEPKPSEDNALDPAFMGDHFLDLIKRFE